MRKRLKISVFIAAFACIALLVFQYSRFVSKIVYEESVSHLTEVFHQSDNMLRELIDKNLTYLHMWSENLQNTSKEEEIRDYIKKAQADAGFLEFYFLSADGNYKTVSYTHLVGRKQSKLPVIQGGMGVGISPVSYTHLGDNDRCRKPGEIYVFMEVSRDQSDPGCCFRSTGKADGTMRRGCCDCRGL